MLTEPQLRERVEELEEEVRQLRSKLHGRPATSLNVGVVRGLMQVAPGEVFVLWTLLEHAPVVLSKQRLTDAYIYQAEQYWGRRLSSMIEPKQMDVRISRLRQALRPYGIEIRTEWGSGWGMPKESAERLRALLEGDHASAG